MIGVVPDQLPGEAESVCPSCAVPEIVGGEVFTGADGGPATTPVAADTLVAEPPLFVAVTATRNVAPASAAATVYELAVAAKTSTQPAPDESQRRH